MKMKTYYVLYNYRPNYYVNNRKGYLAKINAHDEAEARTRFIEMYPDAIIKGIEDYPPQ